ncbi:uncharacterized protein TNCT_336931 [Trichonephila clavata]|uniref:Uncharacterized protein n=1 Tax=Trichonephila clavata TaxID=2740835 RepID=A0A8X6HF25_TRICU|nr:uncharacterized protein TNCT_336931 [Trichonephila clavata]
MFTLQTFVVRYKNGEQTIPVTVVLDYKKQTEYVINMSPRATTKTVTLYDFKQKTIAYKDVTNRECFLGHLTHETLNEEIDALTRIQNPVEHQPKILSLDPHRSSLTPTEIRNMAGQKTAVFCRKMNTWLILPRETHNVKKREVDDEIDERTFHRRGYHTVQYAHYGYERRRRFRNSNRNTTRPLALRRNGASGNPNQNIGNSEVRQAVNSNVSPMESLSLQKKHSNPESAGIRSNEKELFAYPLPNHHTSLVPYSSETTLPPEPAFHHPSFETNLNYERDLFPTLHPHHFNGPKELQSAFDSNVHTNANLRDHIDHKGYNGKEAISQNGPTTIKNRNAFENLEESFIPNSEISEPSHLNGQSVFYNGENTKALLPETKAEFKWQDNNQSSNRNHDLNLNGNLRPSGIEKEFGRFDHHSNINQERFLPKIYDENVSEDPDVSTNVLEIPRITKKFENLDNQLHSNPIIQTNEDVHDVFEGFFNLSRSPPPPKQENFPPTFNTYFPPSESNRGRISDNSNIHGYPEFPDLNIIDNSGSSHQWKDNASPSSNSEVTFSTDYPILTTNSYDNYNRPTTPPNYSNLFTDSVTIKTNQRTREPSPVNFAPRQVDPISRKWDDTSFRPVPASNNHGNPFNKATDTHFSALTPLNKQSADTQLNHRSDIPSETDHIDNIESVTFRYAEESLPIPTKQPSSHVSLDSITEGVSSHQIRFQNAFRNYKPDEIIIDVENIPTQPPPDNTLRLQSRTYPGDEYPNRRISPTLIRPLGGQKSEVVSGETWQGRPIQTENYPRTINSPTGYRNGASFQTRKNNLLLHHPRNDSNQSQTRQQHDNNIRQLTYPNQRIASHQINSFRPYHQLNNLPPGVSIHPRHPKAPYAEMFHSNMPPSVAQGNNFRTLKPHRQRHHKKKDRLPNSCCKRNGNLVSCCRSGGACCTPHRGRSLRVKQPCCSSTKHKNGHSYPQSLNQVVMQNRAPLRQNQVITQNRVPLRQNQMVATQRFPSPQQVRKTVEDPKDRCQKEKLCRTLYESTQQVMVCRNAQIDGC